MSGLTQPSTTYQPLLLSHQTGLSATISTVNTFQNIGSSFTVQRAGVMKITIIGYVSAGYGYITFKVTRGGTTYQLNANSGVSDFINENGTANTYFNNTNAVFLPHLSFSATTFTPAVYFLELPVLSGDVIQTIATNNTSGDIVYITDLLVVMQ